MLNFEILDLGYNSGQFHHRGNLSDTDKQACINVGLLIPYNGSVPNANGTTYTAFAKDCIIFPLRNKQNQVVSIYGRSIQENVNGTGLSAGDLSKAGKHFYLKDRSGLYPGYPSPNTTKLILTEAIIDAATLLQICPIPAFPKGEGVSVLALYGTNGLTEEHKQAIKEWSGVLSPLGRVREGLEIIFFFDGDKAGNEGIKHNATILQELGVKISYIETPENEDINSLLQGHDPEIFTYLLENRKDFFLLNEPVLIEKNQGNDSQVRQEPVQTSGKLNIRNPEFITYSTVASI